MSGDNKIGSGFNVGAGAFNARNVANELDAADGKKDGKIQKDIWNAYAAARGGNSIKNFIDVNSAIRSINAYHQEEAAIADLKKNLKFEAPLIGGDELADVQEKPEGVEQKPVQATNVAEQGVDAGAQKDTLFGGVVVNKDVVVTGNKNKSKHPTFALETPTFNADISKIAPLEIDANINQAPELAEKQQPKVYGSPQNTMPETEFMEKLEQFKPGDVVYVHTTSGGTNIAKVTVQNGGEWSSEPVA